MKKYVGVILREAFIKKIWGRRGEVGDANSIILKIQCSTFPINDARTMVVF